MRERVCIYFAFRFTIAVNAEDDDRVVDDGGDPVLSAVFSVRFFLGFDFLFVAAAGVVDYIGHCGIVGGTCAIAWLARVDRLVDVEYAHNLVYSIAAWFLWLFKLKELKDRRKASRFLKCYNSQFMT